MKTVNIWRSAAMRLVVLCVLVFPLGFAASDQKVVRASQGAEGMPQDEPPIDHSLSLNPTPGDLSSPEDPFESPSSGYFGPDLTVRWAEDSQINTEGQAEWQPAVGLVTGPVHPADRSVFEDPGSDVPPHVPFGAAAEAEDAALPDLTLGINETEADEQAMPAGLTGNLDDFNRVNGALGEPWSDKVYGVRIVGNMAGNDPGTNYFGLSVHTAIGVNEAKARIQTGGTGYVQYTGFAFNYADGEEFIFIKIQDNDTDGLFDTGGCYIGNNGSLGFFGLGFFALTQAFSSGDLNVSVSADRSVKISLHNLVGGGADQQYICEGGPAVNGVQFGIASLNGALMDNVTVEPAEPNQLSTFDDQDGPLGSSWWVHNGSFEIFDGRARGRGEATSLATYNGLGANQIEAYVSLKPGGGLQYAGLVLNADAGSDSVFLKVQDNDGNGTFDHGACYRGNNTSPGFGMGFFSLAAPFMTAHMRVWISNDRVAHIQLTNIDGGSGSQTYDCGGAPSAEGSGIGIASYNGGTLDSFKVIQDFSDNFNRKDGLLGANWLSRLGTMGIVNRKATGLGGHTVATFNGVGGSQIEADVSINPSGGTQYSALVLDYGAGSSNLFIKVQDNGGYNLFNTAGCYIGHNAGSFGLGFFSLTETFETAHMIVRVDSQRLVTLVFTNIDGGSGTQVYICGTAPAAEGPFVGIASLGGALIDNVRVDRSFGLEHFNRPDGALGPSWETQGGQLRIVNQAAIGINKMHNLTLFENLTGNWVEGDIAANPTGAINYSAFVLNYGAGINNILIKFQHQLADPAFEFAACYIGDGSRSFGLGFFMLDSPVMSAHVSIWVNSARTVTILLTRINGGDEMQLYSCEGAPPIEGNLIGIASYYGGLVDNVTTNEFNVGWSTFLPAILR